MSEIEAKETHDHQEVIRNESESSDSEKALGSQKEKVDEHSEYDLPPDPDADLSPEERAKIVRIRSPGGHGHELIESKGSQTHLEARLENNAMGEYSNNRIETIYH